MSRGPWQNKALDLAWPHLLTCHYRTSVCRYEFSQGLGLGSEICMDGQGRCANPGLMTSLVWVVGPLLSGAELGTYCILVVPMYGTSWVDGHGGFCIVGYVLHATYIHTCSTLVTMMRTTHLSNSHIPHHPQQKTQTHPQTPTPTPTPTLASKSIRARKKKASSQPQPHVTPPIHFFTKEKPLSPHNCSESSLPILLVLQTAVCWVR